MTSVEESVAPETDNSVGNEAHQHEVSEADTLNETIGSVGEDESDQCLEDQELEAIKARVREMEEEAEKLKQLQNEVEKQMNLSPLCLSPEEKMEVDNRSIYVGNVDYGATAEELESHFHGCGSVNRVTILCDKFSGHPKGFAYIEFVDKDSVHTAMALDESLFRGRQIKVMVKRTNRPGISTTNRVPRGRFRRGSRNPYYGYRPVRRSFRSRRAWFFSPY
ncbi:polyadenylate-binding protein 2-A-like [Limulus polyphemus]|uniref:Polyadenylate-binding protein 2-A-like n=1 Tax=Limulus polyphemus TaxID=6850 RepID=A0ABM1BWN5_LIMPO|nr:polyadenylate-binding protein 2-A-like [Limulus polyphemus]